MRKLEKIIDGILLIAFGIIVFVAAQYSRGYSAVGGEVFLSLALISLGARNVILWYKRLKKIKSGDYFFNQKFL